MIKFLKNLVKGRKQQCNIPDVSNSAVDKYYCKTDSLIIYTKTNTCRDWYWHYC